MTHEGDHFRTRLTHTLEVAQIARTLARALDLDEDLAEAVALAHDLGHSPFGHAGEAALHRALESVGGFDHNVQTFRVVTRLERRYADFDGLNLSLETLEGVVKHNGPLRGEVPPSICEHGMADALRVQTFPSAEAQVAALADDIAYVNHDVDDGVRAGLFTLGDLEMLPVIGETVRDVARSHTNLERQRHVHESLRRVIDAMVVDVVEESGRRLDAAAPADVEAVRLLPIPVIAFSLEMADAVATLRRFLHHHMYGRVRVRHMAEEAGQIVGDLFRTLLWQPDLLPSRWRGDAGVPGGSLTARVIADYIAGMTDRFATDEHRRLGAASRVGG